MATVYLAIRFRYRPGKNENPKQIHGNTRLEIGWTIVPALILAIIAVPTVATIFDLAKDPGPTALQVTVEGKQWWWQFSYPDAKVVTADEMVIPTGRDVYVHLTSCDGTGKAKTCNVIHSFWVPELAGKKDVVPGQENTMTLSADKPGTYLGQCAEYCGLSHANMRFRVIAKSPADFETWLKQQQQGPVNPLYEADGTTPAGDTQSLIVKTFQCTNCHIFDDSSKSAYGAEPDPPGQPDHLREWVVPIDEDEPRQLGAERAVDDPDVVTGLSTATGTWAHLCRHAVLHREHSQGLPGDDDGAGQPDRRLPLGAEVTSRVLSGAHA